MNLPSALSGTGIDLNAWLEDTEDQVTQPPKFSMTGGAEEYDTIMQTQKLMEGH